MFDIGLYSGLTGKTAISPNMIGVAASAPARTQFNNRDVDFGVDLGINKYNGLMMNSTVHMDNYRKEQACRTDYILTMGRVAKSKGKVLPSYVGVGRNQKSVFPRPFNSGVLLQPVHSEFVNKKNPIKLPA